MQDIRLLKNKILQIIDKNAEEIVGIGEKIYSNPETGFKEFETSRLVAGKLRQLGFTCREFDDIPGVKITVDTGKEGPGVAILGELDSIVCSEHADSDKKTGAVHACGHNTQIAAMLGSAIAIVASGAAEELSGKIHFIAVPAEEYIEVEFRKTLREKGTISYLGGKPELLYRGWFDDVDMCAMVHSTPNGKKVTSDVTGNGCIIKKIRYIGKASHAGGAPDKGINALYAANIGLSAINSLRETFKESDYIRVHPIITKGGDIVNVIPSDVHLETFVRGKTMKAILEANKKVDRALVGAAIAMGAKVQIDDLPGYYPFSPDTKFKELEQEIFVELVNPEDIGELLHTTGSTDMGDLSALMPVIQPYIGGVEGGLHSADFRITDPDTAYLTGAKFLALTAVELLYNDAERAKSIISGFSPIFKTKQEYFDFEDNLFKSKLYDEGELFEE